MHSLFSDLCQRWPKFLDIATQYDELRYHLLPYIYSAAWSVTSKGETLMRALPLEFSSDPGSRAISDQFMFGPALLINPVTTEGAKQRRVYLPASSNWVDFWTGKGADGGQSLTADAPLERIPIYVRGGSIVPFGPVVQSAPARRTRLICGSMPEPAVTSLCTRMKATTTIMSTGPGRSFPFTGMTSPLP
jgi:alpha-glucosidase (family GH31 glycosyl hydrolase)